MTALRCRFRHAWREVSRITWTSDGYSEGKAKQRCTRCGAQRSVFLDPTPKQANA